MPSMPAQDLEMHLKNQLGDFLDIDREELFASDGDDRQESIEPDNLDSESPVAEDQDLALNSAQNGDSGNDENVGFKLASDKQDSDAEEHEEETPEEIELPAPTDPDRAAFFRSIAAETASNFDDAIDALDDVDLDGPAGYFIHVRLGWLSYLKGEFEKSAESYRTAIKVNRESTEARVGLMLPLMAEEQYEEVVTVARKTLSIAPNNYLASLRLAFALRMLEQYEESVEETGRLIERLPTDLDAIAAHVLTLIDMKEHDEADHFLHQMLLIDPDNDFALEKLDANKPVDDYNGNGEVDIHRGKYGDAIDSSLEALRQSFHRSYLAEKEGNYDDAIKILDAVGDVGDDRYYVFQRLGWLHYMRGNFGKSFDYYVAATEEVPTSTEARVGYMLPLLAVKNYAMVIEVANQVLEVDPRNFYANLRMAVALRESDRLDESLSIVRSLVWATPSDLDALAELSKCLEEVGGSA